MALPVRPVVFALAFALVLVGCVGARRDTPPAPPEAIEPVSAAATEASSSAPATNATSPEASSGSTPAASDPATSSAPASTTPPPKPLPYVLNATAKIGWMAAAGARIDPAAQSAEQGRSDADHCPDVAFTMPPGASSFDLASDGAAATPGSPQGGAMRIVVTSPDGNVTKLDPATPPAAGGSLSFASPIPGAWAIHAEPVGPVVQQSWMLTLTARGSALTAPAPLVPTATC